MHIANGISSEIVLRNGCSAALDVGGYCSLHDLEYPLSQGDEVCPECDYFQREVIGWREDEHADISDEIAGDEDEE